MRLKKYRLETKKHFFEFRKLQKGFGYKAKTFIT